MRRAFVDLQLIALIVAPAFGADSNSNSSKCYFVNGETAPDHIPCFPDKVSAGEFSPCCLISNGDVCLDTGICLSVGGMAFQGACTDRDWLSNSCPHRCPDPQNKWQGSSIRPKYWNVLMCATDKYCCREPEDTTNCCNDTLVLSSTTSAIGLPTRAAAASITDTIDLNTAVSSETSSSSSTDVSDIRSSTVAPIDGASNTQCASTTTEARICRGSSGIATVGAGVGVSLGISLIASLVTLAFMIRRHRNLKKELAQARESILWSHEGSTPTSTPMREQRLLLAPGVRELDTPTSRVPELHTSRL